MALTLDEMRIRDTARLEGLIADAMVANRGGDKIDEALDALGDFITKTPFADLQSRASEAVQAADAAQIDVALGALAEIAARLGPAGEVFKSAARIAASGTTDLLFPRLAATASQSLAMFTELQNAVARLQTIPANVDSLKDLPAALDKVKAALADLKDQVKKAGA